MDVVNLGDSPYSTIDWDNSDSGIPPPNHKKL